MGQYVDIFQKTNYSNQTHYKYETVIRGFIPSKTPLVSLGVSVTIIKTDQLITSRRQGGGPYWGVAHEVQIGLSTFFDPPGIGIIGIYHGGID